MTARASTLPLGGGKKQSSGGFLIQRLPEFLRRALNYPQMDMDYTFWQMFNLCIAPAKVYRTTKYHRQTKNQWARDDPAFIALLLYFITVSAVAYAIAFHRNAFGFLKVIFYTVVFDFFAAGAALSTAFWWLANTYLRVDSTGTHATEQKVEWLYAFDVHCNSFFPYYMIIYVVQYFFLPLFLQQNILWTIFANLLYAGAFSYYFFVTFLGYEALPFLQHTTVFLYPIGLISAVALLATLLRINVSRAIMTMCFR